MPDQQSERRTSWPSDVRATTAGLRVHFEDDFDYEDTETFIDAIVGMAAGRAYLRRKLTEHDASTRRSGHNPGDSDPCSVCDQPEGDAS